VARLGDGGEVAQVAQFHGEPPHSAVVADLLTVRTPLIEDKDLMSSD